MNFSSEPLISCIIPTKDRPELIVRAIKSVLLQSYKKIEVIVIDDSTNSFTQQILTHSGLPITYIKNEQSKGANYSRNIGLHEAKGDIISFLDDDDYWMPQKIEKQLKLIHKCPIVSCNCFTNINGRRNYITYPSYVNFEDMLYYNFLGSCSFVIVDGSIIKGCFFDENLKCGQDWDMWLSIMERNSIEEAVNVDEYLVYYNLGSHLRISNVVERIPEVMLIYNKYQARYNSFTTGMFGLYNMIPTNNSLVLRILKGLAIAKKKNKSNFFEFIMMVKKLFGYIEIY